jgi:hypothetical protein
VRVEAGTASAEAEPPAVAVLRKGLQPVGYWIASELPSWGSSFALGGGTIRPKDGRKCVIVVMEVDAEELMPSEAKVLALAKEAEEKPSDNELPYTRDRIRIYDPKQFVLLLADGSGYPGDAVATPGPGIGGGEFDGFANGSILTHSADPVEPGSVDRFAVAWALRPGDCAPPFRVKWGERPAVAVPARVIPPRGAQGGRGAPGGPRPPGPPVTR